MAKREKTLIPENMIFWTQRDADLQDKKTLRIFIGIYLPKSPSN
jgi:hypothetical protein